MRDAFWPEVDGRLGEQVSAGLAPGSASRTRFNFSKTTTTHPPMRDLTRPGPKARRIPASGWAPVTVCVSWARGSTSRFHMIASFVSLMFVVCRPGVMSNIHSIVWPGKKFGHPAAALVLNACSVRSYQPGGKSIAFSVATSARLI